MRQLPGSPTYRLRIHTGPVKEARRGMARALKRSKIKVVDTGTEHVTVDVKANDCSDAQYRVAKALQKKGLRRMSMNMWSASCQRRGRSY